MNAAAFGRNILRSGSKSHTDRSLFLARSKSTYFIAEAIITSTTPYGAVAEPFPFVELTFEVSFVESGSYHHCHHQLDPM